MSTEAVLGIVVAVLAVLVLGLGIWLLVMYGKGSKQAAVNEQLKSLLKAKGMTDEELAKALGEQAGSSPAGSHGTGNTEPWVDTGRDLRGGSTGPTG